jgi:hypothetical protein
MRDRPWIPAVLAGLGIVGLLAVQGGSGIARALFWVVASLVVAWLWRGSRRPIQWVVAVATLPACIVMTFEGGLFLLPAAIALFVVTFAGPRGR